MSNLEARSRKNLIVSGIFGNILEWYDFALYGYFAAIIAPLFFPAHDKTTSLLATFGVFAVGFLMRPFGALVFGHFGDKVGRKKTLVITIILMAVSTMLIGLLPTYQQVGVTAAVLLIICRLLQGLAISGEFGGSVVYLTEHAPFARRGLYGSLCMLGAFAGLTLGSAVSTLLNALMSLETLQNWGWRVPFWAGLLVGAIGLYLRLRMLETPQFLTVQAARKVVDMPVKLAFTIALKSILIATALGFLPAMGFYMLFIYLPSYLTNYLNVSQQAALTINTISMLTAIMLIPVIGWLSDRVGRKPVLVGGAIGYMIFSYPLFKLMQHGSFTAVLAAQMCFAVLACFCSAAIPATLVELFATNIRYTAMAFPYNLANAVFGGTAPLVATYLISKTNNPLSPSFYLIAAGIIMLLAVFIIKESYKKPLID
jgi:MHS family proline/betaine transporter-like MFS transporter